MPLSRQIELGTRLRGRWLPLRIAAKDRLVARSRNASRARVEALYASRVRRSTTAYKAVHTGSIPVVTFSSSL